MSRSTTTATSTRLDDCDQVNVKVEVNRDART
jgi:hypothetical protein